MHFFICAFLLFLLFLEAFENERISEYLKKFKCDVKKFVQWVFFLPEDTKKVSKKSIFVMKM